MNTTTITVWYNGNALSISSIVAADMGLRNGYRIKTEKEFWNILGKNSEFGILKCEAVLTANKNQN